MVPDLASRNMLAKQPSCRAGTAAAGIILGTRAPTLLASRTNPVRACSASCVVAVLMTRARNAVAA
jgi:phosphotransacetylase